jgi:cytochrome oxidase assembly protein ShyY1
MNWRFTGSEGSPGRRRVPDPAPDPRARRRSAGAVGLRSAPVRYRFLRSPRWIIGHLIVIAMAVTMVELGLWQLRRLDEKHDRRDVVRAALAAQPVPLAQIPEPQRYQRVQLEGRYDGATLLIANRSYQGQSGYEVVTPFVLADGGATALVDRGWIPLSPTVDRLPPLDAPAAGPVTVVGIVDRQPGDAVIWDTGATTDGRLVRGTLPSNTTIQLETQDPPIAAGQPVVLDLPDTGLGPHLSYALQWFTFTAMLLAFYPLLIRRSAQQREKAARRAANDSAAAGAPVRDRSGDGGGTPVEPGARDLELGGQAEQDVLLAEAPGELHAER